jgi:DNA-binding response OmpR family regulator
MDRPFTILIADKNRHVRDFLRRELGAEGYRVRLAKDGRRLLMMIHLEDPPDLVILDPEIPYSGELEILEQIHAKTPPVPLIIHTFLTEYANNPLIGEWGIFVEKRGNIDHLKAAVSKMLKKCYSDRALSHNPVGLEAKSPPGEPP